MNVFEEYFSEYRNTRVGFEKFHNEVINMPRDQFSNTGLDKIRLLSGYLLMTEGKINVSGTNYKEIMKCISEQLKKDIFPLHRDIDFENRYFVYDNLDVHYNSEGRMFRHVMSLCAFFGFIKTISRQHKIINYDKCREYYLAENKIILMPIARNNLMFLNAKDNDFIKSLQGIDIDDKTDYRPTYAILRYIQQINRPATKFELSILLGRIDNVKKESDIIERALNIGRILPNDEKSQIPYFLSNMNWKENDILFSYAASQEPYFKFNSYILFMESFDLIKFDEINNNYSLTEYAKDLLQDDISYLIADLERLLSLVDNYEKDNSELNDLILYQRNPELLRLAKEDVTFIEKMNKRSINNPIYDHSGKRQRNRLIAELAKIQADYKCQYAQRTIFKMPNGKYYCEAHHIIEFNAENGPDITSNLVVLGPEAHMIIHHACREEVDDVFMQLIKNGVLKIDRFKEMITVYHCLTESQIEILWNKKIITSNEKQELLELLAS